MTGHPFFPASSAAAPGPPQAWLARPYSQLLRGPTYRWWRPLLSVAVVAGWVGLIVLVIGVGLGVLAATGSIAPLADGSVSDDAVSRWTISPVGLAVTNLLLASMVPGAQLAVWGGFGWRPRWVASVRGGVRWGLLLRCYLVTIVVVGVLTGILVAATGGMEMSPEPNALVLGLVVLLTTPLQAAGEEYLFRGWLTQAIGSAIPGALAGAVAGGLGSAVLFAFAHGQQDVWLFTDRFGFGLLASWLVWRTGGLEASIAVHGANNLLAFAMTLLSGGLSEMLNATQGSPQSSAVDLGMLVVTVLLIDQLARRTGVVRLFSPPVRAW
jgi:hypothetical protein